MSKIILIILIIAALALVAWGLYFFLANRTPSATPTPGNQSTQSANKNTNAGPTTMIENMQVQVEQQGSGFAAKNGDTVTVNYVGTLSTGQKFDSSYDRKTPFTFVLGKGSVIRGWDLGVVGMKVGEKRKLTIPPNLAYGAAGFPGVIPPNATLTFEVELLKIVPGK